MVTEPTRGVVGDRRRATWRTAVQHLAVELINAVAVGLVAIVAAVVARVILWVASGGA